MSGYKCLKTKALWELLIEIIHGHLESAINFLLKFCEIQIFRIFSLKFEALSTTPMAFFFKLNGRFQPSRNS